MIDSINKLAPFALIKQTLRVGNAATMINGMLKLMLTKMSAGSFTNWMGLTSGADEGMNLLQQIMSTILGWDIRELKKQLTKVEKDKDCPSSEVRDTLKQWTEKDRDEHIKIREASSKPYLYYTVSNLCH